MTEMKHEVWIEAELPKIYKSVATIDGLKGWWTSEVEHNPDEKTLKFGFYDGKYWMKFKILGTEENKKVEWECVETDDGSTDWLGTKIIITIEEGDGNYKVHLNHSKWKDSSKIFAMCNSTWGNLMYSLKEYVETGEGEPMS